MRTQSASDAIQSRDVAGIRNEGPYRRTDRKLGASHQRRGMSAFRTWVNSPTGPKTTHFWGPIANWGFVLAGIADTKKAPEMLSPNMTGVMCVYSMLFMRFAWVIQPRNYLLLACHASNETVQLYQFSRWARWYSEQPPAAPAVPAATSS